MVLRTYALVFFPNKTSDRPWQVSGYLLDLIYLLQSPLSEGMGLAEVQVLLLISFITYYGHKWFMYPIHAYEGLFTNDVMRQRVILGVKNVPTPLYGWEKVHCQYILYVVCFFSSISELNLLFWKNC